MNWLHYLVEANLYLAVFYVVYYLFLSNQTWYNLNRVYLLISSILAFVIPVFQLGFLKPPVPQLINITLLPPVNYTKINIAVLPIQAPKFTWQDGLVDMYLIGVAILFIVFLVKVYQLFKLTRDKNSKPNDSYKLVYVPGSNIAFSFFNFLFIGTETQKADTIIRHELVHITQKHSADIIFIELLKIINWFNPFVYLLQRSLKATHEYIADEKTAMDESDAVTYSTFLVNNAYGLSGSSITHSFFNYNLLKKRIIMLNQQRSGKLARLRYLVAIPVCAGMLCASTLAFSKNYAVVDIVPAKADTSQNPRYDVWDKNYDHTFTTSMGYAVHERVIFINGAVSKTAEIVDNDGQKHLYNATTISHEDYEIVKEKYGYKFPVDTVIDLKLVVPTVHELPASKPVPAIHQRPSPSPSPAPAVHELPTPTPTPVVKQITLVQQSVHIKPTFTKTGYRYEEDGYTVKGKTDFRVIIFEKNSDPKKIFKSKATTADLKLLKDKYGYTFPVMEIYTTMPPPAPAKPRVDNRPPPPPPAPPVKTTKLLKTMLPFPDFFTALKKSC